MFSVDAFDREGPKAKKARHPLNPTDYEEPRKANV